MAVVEPPLALVASVMDDQVTERTESDVADPLAGALTAFGTVSAYAPLVLGSERSLKPLVF